MKALMFFAGLSTAVVLGWFFKITDTKTVTEMVALSWFAGILIGAWATGIVMFMFSQLVGNAMAERLRPRRPKSEVIDLDEAIFIEDDEEENIYDDPDWWKNEAKREKHRRGQNG